MFRTISIIMSALCIVNTLSQDGWIAQRVDSNYHFYFSSFVDTNVCFIGGSRINNIYGGRIYSSTDGCNTWFNAGGAYKALLAMHFNDKDTGFKVSDERNFLGTGKTHNGGLTWTSMGISNPSSYYHTVYFLNASTGYVISLSEVRKTTNGGANWTTVNYLGQVNSILSMVFVNYSTGFITGINSVTSSSTIAKTTDQGSTWTYYDINTTCKKLAFPSSTAGYGICSNGKVIKTVNCGVNWQFIDLPQAVTLVSVSFGDVNTGYVLSSPTILFKTTSAGSSWTQISLPLSVSKYSVSFSSPNRGIISCANGYVLKTTTGGEPLGIKQLGKEIPSQFELRQNYPNPFNPETKIVFNLPSSSKVVLKVYDVQGRELLTLASGYLNAGVYEATWEAGSFGCGVYFVRIFAGDFWDSKKMVLIK